MGVQGTGGTLALEALTEAVIDLRTTMGTLIARVGALEVWANKPFCQDTAKVFSDTELIDMLENFLINITRFHQYQRVILWGENDGMISILSDGRGRYPDGVTARSHRLRDVLASLPKYVEE